MICDSRSILSAPSHASSVFSLSTVGSHTLQMHYTAFVFFMFKFLFVFHTDIDRLVIRALQGMWYIIGTQIGTLAIAFDTVKMSMQWSRRVSPTRCIRQALVEAPANRFVDLVTLTFGLKMIHELHMTRASFTSIYLRLSGSIRSGFGVGTGTCFNITTPLTHFSELFK